MKQQNFIKDVRICLHRHYGEIDPIIEYEGEYSAPYATFKLPDGLLIEIHEDYKLVLFQTDCKLIIENGKSLTMDYNVNLYNNHKELIEKLCMIK